MKNWLLLLLGLVGLLGGSSKTCAAPEQDEELRLIQILQSATAGPSDKDAACARLKIIGTARSVPALASLLADEQLSHSARYALEPMATPEAGRALRDSLRKTKGLVRVGIINSLGVREEKDAVPDLVDLLKDPDSGTSGAAAYALGQVGDPEAVTALRAAARNPASALHSAAVEALLRCANRMLISGQRTVALAVFEQLDVPAENESVRVAAFRGRVGASGNAGLNMVIHAIAGPPGPSQVAAFQLARGLQVPHTTRELARLLPDLQPPIQVALVGVLAQRDDVAAVPFLKTFAGTASPETWVPIIEALDTLGDASVVPLLGGWAASELPEVQPAARRALADLHRGNVTQALIDQLGKGSAAVQAEMARALGTRRDRAAVPQLVVLAQRGTGSARYGALQALSVLVDDSQTGALVDLVTQTNDQDGRVQAAEALNSALLRIQAQLGHVEVAPLLLAVEKGPKEARGALLPICSGLSDPKVRASLRLAVQDKDDQVRAAAIRALCDTIDGELLPDLLELARSTREDSVRALAINGAVRLVTQEDTARLNQQQRVTALKSLLACASSPEQKRKVLAGLGEVADSESLAIIETTLADSAVRNEAARAAVKVASGLPGSQILVAETALKKALAAADDEGTRRAVQSSLQQLHDNAGFLTDWQMAGPYLAADKDYAALFDVAFPPESTNSQTVKWLPIPAGTDPKRPGVMDLLKALGGQQCVAYARTWIHSDQQQAAILELGSDDGVKVWLNNKQVYALNAARPLQAGSDKVNVTLLPGWNALLLKVTQNNQGWEFCVRVRNTQGSHLDGLRFASAPIQVNK